MPLRDRLRADVEAHPHAEMQAMPEALQAPKRRLQRLVPVRSPTIQTETHLPTGAP